MPKEPPEQHEVRKLAIATIKVGKRLRPLGDISSLSGTEWEDNQRALMKLCKLAPEMQEKVARKAASWEEIHHAIVKAHREKQVKTAWGGAAARRGSGAVRRLH